MTGISIKPHTALLILIAVTAAVYANSLMNGFVWDDKVLLVPNRAYQEFDLLKIFTTKANSVEYLPVRDLSYVLDYLIWGMNPFGFHLTNLLLYLLALPVLYLMLAEIIRMTGRQEPEFIAFWTTAIFALHPLHAEVVNFIYGRNTLLAALFLFASCLLCLKGLSRGKNGLIILSLLSFTAALFSKAIVLFFPLFLGGLFLLVPETNGSVRKKMIILGLFSAVAAAALLVHFRIAASQGVMDVNFIMYGSDNWGLRLMKAFQIPFFYLKMYLLPYPLSVDYPASFLYGGIFLRGLAGGAALLLLFLLSWLLRKNNLVMALAVVWSLTSLVPVMNLFPTSPVVADRYAYLPVLGFGLATAYAMDRMANRKKFVIAAGLVILTLWSLLIFRRNTDWISDIALWESAARANPAMSRVNLADVLWSEGKYEEALKHLGDEQQKTGGYHYYQYQGRLLKLRGQYQEAVLLFKEALQRGGDALREIHLDLADALEKSGRDAEALQEYLKTIETRSIDPLGRYSAAARDGIGRLHAKLAPQLNDLRARASGAADDFQVQSAVALQLHQLGFYDDAEMYYRKALEIDPSSWVAWHNLGLLYQKKQDWTAAVDAFGRSLRIHPGNRDGLNNMGVCFMAMGQYGKAIVQYKQALSIDPSFFFATFNLGRVYFVTGDRENATIYFRRAGDLARGNPALQTRIDTYMRQLR